MKNHLLKAGLFLSLLFCNSFYMLAQAPEAFTYQGEARDKTGKIMDNKSLNVKVSIVTGATLTATTSVWTREYPVKTDGYGLFSIQVGDAPGETTFGSISWGTGKYYVNIQILSGKTWLDMGTTQLLSVPYALYAKSAGTIANSETDPVFKASPSSGIKSADITNWNTAFGWGSHSGLYRPSDWVPSWTEVTGNPFLIDPSPKNGDLLWFDGVTGRFINRTPSYLESGQAVTSVSGTAPIISSGGTTPVISINPATTSEPGSMSAADKVKLNAQATGTAPGQMQYWNGTAWVTIPVGQSGQVLILNSSNVPVWTSIGLPRLTTSSVTSITSSTATSGGIVNNFGESVTNRGVCWSTSAGPTIALSTKTTNGSGTGVFTSSITGLEPNTLYYVRAFATSNSGTYYGDEISFTSGITVGDSYGGGIVAYVLQSGDPGYSASVKHGFIATEEDYPSTANWGCFGTSISGAHGTDLGTGAQNTLAIVAGCSTAGIAARLCSDLVLNGYDDWFLPSKEELRKLYLNRDAIGGFNFSAYSYWSSSEYDNNSAWNYYNMISYTSMNWVYKNNPYRFRPIRAF